MNEEEAPTLRPADRWLLAIALVLVDLVVFALPLTGLAAAWILLARPPWFREWVERLYEGGSSGGAV